MPINSGHGQILITSTSKAYTKAKKTGKLNLGRIALYNLIAYYANFTYGKEEFNQEYAFLLDKLLQLQYDHPNEICDYKFVLPTGGPATANTAPSVDDNTVDLLGNSFYTFTVGDFLVNYTDAEQHSYKYLLVNPATQPNGLLRTGPLGTTEITSPIIFDIEGLNASTEIQLNFKRTNSAAFSGADSFIFRVSDNPEDFLYSANATMNINATLVEGTSNLPATIGDNTLYVDNRTETIFTLADFTTNLAPPYNDPEADLIDAIRIDEISEANLGKYYLNGVEIAVNDIITREDLNAGLFKHVAADQDAISSDVFYFSARDEGSQIWVQ